MMRGEAVCCMAILQPGWTDGDFKWLTGVLLPGKCPTPIDKMEHIVPVPRTFLYWGEGGGAAFRRADVPYDLLHIHDLLGSQTFKDWARQQLGGEMRDPLPLLDLAVRFDRIQLLLLCRDVKEAGHCARLHPIATLPALVVACRSHADGQDMLRGHRSWQTTELLNLDDLDLCDEVSGGVGKAAGRMLKGSKGKRGGG